MMHPIAARLIHALIGTTLVAAAVEAPAIAQITPDRTLGAEASQLGEDGRRIRGGAQRGDNLFHSFSEFNIGDRQQVDFENPAGVRTIFGRVTGGRASRINGTLGVLGPADLFLLNPNGIVFGRNARLSVQGSFLASTASGIRFGNVGSFDAIAPQIPSNLLTIAPSALVFNRQAGGAIAPITLESGARLNLRERQSLLLSAGDLQLTDARIEVDGGQIDLAAIQGEGELTLARNPRIGGLQQVIPADLPGGTILLSDYAQVNAEPREALTQRPAPPMDPGNITVYGVRLTMQRFSRLTIENSNDGSRVSGSITVNARQVELRTGARIFGRSRTDGPAGDITIDTNGGEVFISDRTPNERDRNRPQESGIFTDTSDNARGRTGTVQITTGLLEMRNGAQIEADTEGVEEGGFIRIRADRINIVGANISARSAAPRNARLSSGRGGRIEIWANRLTLEGREARDGFCSGGFSPCGQISTVSNNITPPGPITITANQIELTNGGRISSRMQAQRTANRERRTTRGGDITINTNGGTLRIQGTTGFSARSHGQESGIFADVSDNSANGPGNNIVVNTGTLQLLDLGEISTRTEGRGDSGNITIRANRIDITGGSRITTRTEDSGNAGNIVVDLPAGNLLIAGSRSLPSREDRRSGISATTDDDGTAGDITINGAADVWIRENGAIAAASIRNSESAGGTIRLQTDRLRVTQNATIAVSSEGTGVAGDVAIDAREVLLRENGSIQAGTISQSGGNITLRVDERVLLQNRSQISASTVSGRGGNIVLRVGDRVLLQNRSQISVSTESGQGGSIRIGGNAEPLQQIEVRDRSQITAEARGETGRAGSINLRADTISVQDRPDAAGSPLRAEVTRSSVLARNLRNRSPQAAGNITIQGNQLQVSNGEISASTQRGRAGDLSVSASTVTLQNRGALSVEATEAGGIAGDLSVTGDRTIVQSGASISASTRSGTGGNITLNSDRVTVQNGASISASTRSGTGGDITFTGLDTLEVRGGEITASTGTGRGGSLSVTAADSIEVSDRGRLSVAATNGSAGNLRMNADRLTVSDGGRVAVDSANGFAGNLTVNARSISLDRGQLTAETGGGGGNIQLRATEQLFLRNNSRISAEASNRASGGNVAIDVATGFVVATPNENNDIVANAFEGRGGRIDITTQAILGLQEGRSLGGNLTNDIDASSEFGAQGSVTINRPDVEPDAGLADLPIVPITTELAQGCQIEGGQANAEFFNTGRGGLPPNPYEPFSSSTVIEDLRLPTPVATIPEEAQGWVVGDRGEVTLVTAIPSDVAQTQCRLN